MFFLNIGWHATSSCTGLSLTGEITRDNFSKMCMIFRTMGIKYLIFYENSEEKNIFHPFVNK